MQGGRQSSADASDLGLAAGDEVQLRLTQRTDAPADGLTGTEPMATAEIYRLPVRFKPELLHGTAGLPAGLPGLGVLAGIALPAWGELKKAEKGIAQKGKQVEE